ncbi:MAG: molybdopterin-dependent oxidoreductase [Candidatus Kariarchaeaceae archaeon]|jgi:anaerobic selenocysteine-containing dehydrogenase
MKNEGNVSKKPKHGFVERMSMKIGLLPTEEDDSSTRIDYVNSMTGELSSYPPVEKWDHWIELDLKNHPNERVPKAYSIVPTTCFNCESACGLLAYVDKEDRSIKRFEGNPLHPASRGRNCAKGPATINQITDPERILYPLKRDGPRGSGKWKRVSWDEAVKDISSRMRKAIEEKRHDEIMYQVGRPGHEGFMNWVLPAWGCDAHNSHTNICSSGARTGYALWHHGDRPSPDFSNARFILLISAHLESGHYFNPHAQRIIEAKNNGTKIATLDPRLSNTASMSDFWVPTYPGSEAAVLLALAKIIIDNDWFNAEYLKEWTNWETYLERLHPKREVVFEQFIEALKEDYSGYTLEYAGQEAQMDPSNLPQIAKEIADAGTRFAYHNWRASSSGNLGGWQTARCLHFLGVLVGAIGTVGGTSPNHWSKFKPKVHTSPKPQEQWNELLWPPEYPLTNYELGFLLPHLLKDGTRGKVDVYFSRVFNPVWTHPDGFSWMEVLSDENLVGMHVAMTPTWNETAYFADYVLPMGHSAERHDLSSYATHQGKWIAFRQPVLREAMRRQGKEVEYTYETNPGEVWEEDEFWIDLSWNIDLGGELGIRKHFESPSKPGTKLTVDEYYEILFGNIPTLVEEAKKENLTALEYMRKHGAFEVEKFSLKKNLKELSEDQLEGATVDETTRVIIKDGKSIGIQTFDGAKREGFGTPSRRQEIYSTTMEEWGWKEYTTPGYIKSHIHWEEMDESKGELVLVPTFRLPALIHSRSGNAKWLAEISHTNPVWMNPETAKKFGVKSGDLIRVSTEIGYFVNKAWVTEGLRPNMIACSHHIGRWRRDQDPQNNIWAMNTIEITETNSLRKIKHKDGVTPRKTDDPDTERIWWREGGVHQNITFPVHPDPISGMHAWHQKVSVEKAHPGDEYGDVLVDTEKARNVYKEWLAKTRPGPGPGGLRRPLWMKRPFTPDLKMYKK